MTAEFPEGALAARAKAIYEQLLEMYGHHPNVPRRTPMHELLSTILSHRTTQANEALAYDRMMERFQTFEGVRDAPLPELIETISVANYPEQKAPRLQEVLRIITAQRGSLDISFLQDLPVEEALRWLTSLPGVGPKTSSLVMLFCFAKPVLPVDTHVHRVSQRLGLIGPRVSADAAHALLLTLFPKDPQVLFNFHINGLLHGQRLCLFTGPRCRKCALAPQCLYYAQTNAPTKQETPQGDLFSKK